MSARLLIVALLAFAVAGLAVMAAPSLEEEVAPASGETSEVRPPKEDGTPSSEEFEEEEEETNRADVCANTPLIVLREIKELLQWRHEEAEEYMLRLFLRLNNNNAEEAQVDFRCMVHLAMGQAALENMEKVLAHYADKDNFAKVMEDITDLNLRMKAALSKPATEISDVAKVARRYISFGLGMERPRILFGPGAHAGPEHFGPPPKRERRNVTMT